MMVLAAASIVALAQAAPPTAAPPPAAPPTAPARPTQVSAEEALARMPWFARLGARSLEVEVRLAVRDQVVLVPDAASFVAEIAKWTPSERWPVLVEDASFAPRFIRAFKPSTVLRRSVADSGFADAAPVRAAVDGALARAWGGTPEAGPIAALRTAGVIPAGIVAASASDPAWIAALALAAGRGQPLVWLEQPLGASADDVVDAASFGAFDSAVRAAFETSGLSWTGLGVQLDAFTLCRRAGVRVSLASPPGGRNPGIPADAGPFALTDALCRHPDGSRYAFAAQVHGDAVRASSMAMCSLFLRRTEAWAFDGYGGRGAGAPFAQYGFERVVPALESAGFKVRAWQGEDGTVDAWRGLLPAGVSADVMFLNSSGNADFLELARSAVAPSTDIPVLRRPLALQMVHSFSLQVPDAGWSVGGRWLAHGAYAYVGSVHEPFLLAFVPPAVFVDRLSALTPFLVAGRQWQGDTIPQVWRITTLGDPLMTIPAPKTAAMFPGRIGAAPVDGEVDVRAQARAALERSKSAADESTVASALAAAMRDLVACGDDAVAAQLWQLARSRGAGPAAAVAPAALGPLFRAGARASFMEAWTLVPKPSFEERDMLWQMWATDLRTLRDRGAIAVLKAAVREPRLDQDAQALLPALRATEGDAAAVEWMNGLMQRTQDPEVKRRLAQLQA